MADYPKWEWTIFMGTNVFNDDRDEGKGYPSKAARLGDVPAPEEVPLILTFLTNPNTIEIQMTAYSMDVRGFTPKQEFVRS